MDEYKNFTSLPEDQERTFVVFERFSRESAQKAMRMGIIAGAIFFVVTMIVVFSHSKPTESKIKKEDIQTSQSGADEAPADTPDTSDSAKTKKDDEAEAWEDDEGGDEEKADNKDEGKKDEAKADDKKADDKKDEGKKDDKK